jgi:oxygen-dependent protoporphyrinogen oxidase
MIQKNTRVKLIELRDRQYHVSISTHATSTVNKKTLAFDQVISTIPAHSLNEILVNSNFNPLLQRQLERVSYAPIAIVALSYHQFTNPYPGYGYLVRRQENSPILGAYFNNQTFPELSKAQGASFTVLLGGAHFSNFEHFSKEDFQALAVQALSQHLGIKEEPIFNACHILPRAIPQFEIGYEGRNSAITRLTPPGFFVSGNFVSGAGVSDIVAHAQKMVNLVLKNEASDGGRFCSNFRS